MTPRSGLEIQGNFLTHPFAEMAAEIREAKLDGSLRCAYGEKKCIFYFKAGRLRFAVSNSRSSRIFERMFALGKMSREDIVKIPNFQNDFEFTSFLLDTGFLHKAEVERLFVSQIEGILIEVLSWPDGQWTFTPLVRLRDGLEFDIRVRKMLVDAARILPIDTVLRRFRSLNEEFELGGTVGRDIELLPNEQKLLSMFVDAPLRARDLAPQSGIPEHEAIKSLYVLWLGGYLIRQEWNPAFSEMSIANLQSVKLELKQEAKLQVTAAPTPKTEELKKDESAASVVGDATISIDEYLDRVETAETYYDLLGIDHKSEIADIKRAYFNLAKQFHPDHFHKAGDEMLRRVQSAFTKLSQAHETLRSADSRETYDFKIRREIAEKEKRQRAGTYEELSVQMRQANESFEQGFSLLMDGNPEAAETFLARASHFAPKNAKYHAYYGKALAANAKQRHKAEGEMQTAVKLDGNNPTYRLMLAEFFIQMNLMKRAEGELNRLLAIFPSNREAKEMLSEIKG